MSRYRQRCNIKFRNRNPHKGVNRTSKFESFYDELSKNGKDVFILVRKESGVVAFVSENSKDLLGIRSELIMDDLWTVKRTMDVENCHKLDSILQKWDRESPLITELPFRNMETMVDYWGKLQIKETADHKYFLVMIEDITKEYKTRVKMQKEMEEVYRIDESKTSYLSKMSHEIRTPMNSMLGMISLAKMNIDKPNEARDYLEKAENLSQFLLSIINDILDISRIESGKVELAKEKFDIFELSERLRAMFETTIEDKGIKFTMEMKDFSIRYFIGDELRISQVLSNFLSNASKFTPAGGSISVMFRQMHIVDHNINIMMRVRDTGRGMSQEFLSHIFNPFEQESVSIAKEHGGSGLGMSIADNMVHLMGGEITVNSEIGKGTEFTVILELPIAEGDQTMPVLRVRTASEEEEGTYGIDGYRLLLAEDNDINALIAMKLLNARGADVERAANGQEAVDMFAEKELGYYDAILMDIQMPELGGWEATKIIRSMPREDACQIPILALSADAFVEDKRKSIEIGMNGHVSKPINFKELATTIRKCKQKELELNNDDNENILLDEDVQEENKI